MRKILLACLMLMAMFAAAAVAQNDEQLYKGVELYQEGKFAEAVDVLRQFVDKDKNHWVANTYLGGSLANLGRNEEAIIVMSTKLVNPPPSVFPLDSRVKIKKKARAVVTKDAVRNKTIGDVQLFVEFKADGKIGFVLPIKSLPDGLTESAIEAARKFKFEPAVKNQKPVSTIRSIIFTFGPYPYR